MELRSFAAKFQPTVEETVNAEAASRARYALSCSSTWAVTVVALATAVIRCPNASKESFLSLTD
jgi:hypothetical protein